VRRLTSEQIDHLFAVYAVERQDDQSALTVAFAIATAGMTYVIAGTAYLGDHCSRSGCRLPAWIQLMAPIIPISLVGFLALNVAGSRMRSVHLQRLEETLQIPLPNGGFAPQFHTDAGLIFRPDHMSREPRIRIIFGLITFVAYGALGLITVGFTWVALIYGGWGPLKTAIAAIYGFAELVELLGVAAPLTHPRFRYR
jgi:hypothetical protein